MICTWYQTCTKYKYTPFLDSVEFNPLNFLGPSESRAPKMLVFLTCDICYSQCESHCPIHLVHANTVRYPPSSMIYYRLTSPLDKLNPSDGDGLLYLPVTCDLLRICFKLIKICISTPCPEIDSQYHIAVDTNGARKACRWNFLRPIFTIQSPIVIFMYMCKIKRFPSASGYHTRQKRGAKCHCQRNPIDDPRTVLHCDH